MGGREKERERARGGGREKEGKIARVAFVLGYATESLHSVASLFDIINKSFPFCLFLFQTAPSSTIDIDSVLADSVATR